MNTIEYLRLLKGGATDKFAIVIGDEENTLFSRDPSEIEAFITDRPAVIYPQMVDDNLVPQTQGWVGLPIEEGAKTALDPAIILEHTDGRRFGIYFTTELCVSAKANRLLEVVDMETLPPMLMQPAPIPGNNGWSVVKAPDETETYKDAVYCDQCYKRWQVIGALVPPDRMPEAMREVWEAQIRIPEPVTLDDGVTLWGDVALAIWDKEIEIAVSDPWENEKTNLRAFVDKLKQGHASRFLQGALASDVCHEDNVTHMEMAALELHGCSFEHWLTELRLRETCAILWACPDDTTTSIPRKLLQQCTLRAARDYLSFELGYDDDWLEGMRLGEVKRDDPNIHVHHKPIPRFMALVPLRERFEIGGETAKVTEWREYHAGLAREWFGAESDMCTTNPVAAFSIPAPGRVDIIGGRLLNLHLVPRYLDAYKPKAVAKAAYVAKDVKPFRTLAKAREATQALIDRVVIGDTDGTHQEVEWIAECLGLTELVKQSDADETARLLCGDGKRTHPVNAKMSTFMAAFKRSQEKMNATAVEDIKAKKEKKKAKDGKDGWLPDGVQRAKGRFWAMKTTEKGGEVEDGDLCREFQPVDRIVSADEQTLGVRIESRGVIKTLTLEMLHGSASELRLTLDKELDLDCTTRKNQQDILTELIRKARGHEKLPVNVALSAPGWHFDNKVFACANGKVLGTPPNGKQVHLHEDAGYKERAPDGVGQRAVEEAVYEAIWAMDEPYWQLGDLLGLSAAVQGLVGCRNIGPFLAGVTRGGKTTFQRVQTARATNPEVKSGKGGVYPLGGSSEGVEMPLRNSRHNPIAFDESGNIKDRNVRDMPSFFYSVTGGTGKPRMARSADRQREAHIWEVMPSFSSETERDMLISGGGGRTQAGLVNRIPNIDLAGLISKTDENRRLAKRIEVELNANHGHTYATFVAGLMKENGEQLRQDWYELTEGTAGDAHHLRDAAELFALLELTGKVAADMGLTKGMTAEKVTAAINAAWAQFSVSPDADRLVPGKVEVACLKETVIDQWDRGIIGIDEQLSDQGWKDRLGYYSATADRLYLRVTAFDEMTGRTGSRAGTLKALQAAGELILAKDGRHEHAWIEGLGRVRHYALPLEKFMPLSFIAGAGEEDEQ